MLFLFATQGLRFSPATLRESIVIVVSPLISLMQDQVRAMIERNVTAVYIGGADDKLEAEICAGNYQLVYCSPESLFTLSLLSHKVVGRGDHNYDILMKTTRSRVRLHSCMLPQKPVQMHQTYFPPPLFSAHAKYAWLAGLR